MLNVCAYFFMARDTLEFSQQHTPSTSTASLVGDMKESGAHNAGGIKGFFSGPQYQGPLQRRWGLNVFVSSLLPLCLCPSLHFSCVVKAFSSMKNSFLTKKCLLLKQVFLLRFGIDGFVLLFKKERQQNRKRRRKRQCAAAARDCCRSIQSFQ